MSTISQDELEQLAAETGSALKQRGWRMVTAESCTGGWIAQTATAVSGSSAWFDAGLVTYSNYSKAVLLGVSNRVLSQNGAVSEPVVQSMAQSARQMTGADICVAVSGIAGPSGGTPDKPVGTVWFAWEWADGSECRCEQFSGGRAEIRAQAVAAAFQGVLKVLAAAG